MTSVAVDRSAPIIAKRASRYTRVSVRMYPTDPCSRFLPGNDLVGVRNVSAANSMAGITTARYMRRTTVESILVVTYVLDNPGGMIDALSAEHTTA